MVRYAGLAVALFLFWMLLSGFFTAGFLILGLVICIGAVALAHRMHTIDDEGYPVQLFFGAVAYWPWLIVEILKSGWSVSRIIVDPALPISPTVIVVKASQKTTSGRNTYANSITLTPGTVTIAVDDENLTVHALTRENALDLASGDMDRRVSRFEGSSE